MYNGFDGDFTPIGGKSYARRSIDREYGRGTNVGSPTAPVLTRVCYRQGSRGDRQEIRKMFVIVRSVRMSVQRPEDVALQSMRVTVVGDHLCVVVKHCEELWQVSDIDLHRRDGKDCTETQDCHGPPMSSLSTALSSNHAGCALAASWRSLSGLPRIQAV